MRRAALDQYIQKNIEAQDRLQNGKDDVGLFTFYRSQEEEENKLKQLGTKPETHSHHKHQQKTKFNFYGLNRSSIHGKNQQKQQLQSSNKNYQLFLKNVVSSSSKAKNNSKYEKQKIRKEFIDKQLHKEQHRQSNKTQHQKKLIEDLNTLGRVENQLIQPKQIAKYQMALEADKGFIVRPLKRIEELLQNCQQKINGIKKKDSKSKSEATKVGDQKWFNNALNQQSSSKKIKIVKLNKDSQKRAIKISVEREGGQNEMSKSLQKSFLQKLRQKQTYQASLHERQKQKQMTASKTIENFHDQNKKYLCNLINHCYLPHNQSSLAAKILRNTLKFPNLIIKNYIMKTESNSHSDIESIQDLKSISSRKDNLAHAKVMSQSESEDLKPTMNERFKFLLRRQRTNNDFFKHNNPRHSQMRKEGKRERKVQI